ncbi:6007_t:CDS:2, partial [Funneliformis geosporum]
KEVGNLRSSMIGSSERSENFRTYNFLKNRVTDKRLGIKLENKLEFVIEGDLEEICRKSIDYELMNNNQVIKETIRQKLEKKDKNNDDYLILKLNDEEVIFVFPGKKKVRELLNLNNFLAKSNFKNLAKKEQVSLEKRRNKLQSIYEGVTNLYQKPDALFIIGLNKEKTAFKEAKKVGIPVIAVCNTNCNPNSVDYVIPGNDENTKSVSFFANLVADAIVESKKDNKIVEGNRV